MRSFIALLLVLGFGLSAQAGSFTLSKGVGYKLEPLYGYETVYRTSPSPHTATRAMYGVRVTVGVDLLSGEAEYSKASDTKNFINAPETVKYNDTKYKLGLKSTYRFNDYIFASFRAGGQATETEEERTSAGVVTVEKTPIKYHPYAGATLGVRVAGVVSLNLGSTMVFKDNRDLSKNDFQHTASISVGY